MVAGADHKPFLHALLTQDILALEAGSGCYAAYLTAQGRMIADMRLFELGDMALLDVAPGLAGPLAARFDALVFSEDVRLADVSDRWGTCRIVGPDSARVAASALAALPEVGSGAADPSSLASLREYSSARVACGDTVVHVMATREWGLPGLDIYAERGLYDRLLAALGVAGAATLSHEAAEALRIEAGTPLFPLDLDTETIPLEAGIESRAISFTKGCYPGQEIIIRVVHRGGGRVARRLVGLVVEGTEIPARGDLLAVGDREVGRITSAAWSPGIGRPVALGYAHHDFVEPATAMDIRASGGALRAKVSRLPFVGRQLADVRS